MRLILENARRFAGRSRPGAGRGEEGTHHRALGTPRERAARRAQRRPDPRRRPPPRRGRLARPPRGLRAVRPGERGLSRGAAQPRAFVGLRIEDGVSAHVTAGEPQGVRVIGDANVIQYIVTLTEPQAVGTTTIPVLRVRVTEGYSRDDPALRDHHHPGALLREDAGRVARRGEEGVGAVLPGRGLRRERRHARRAGRGATSTRGSRTAGSTPAGTRWRAPGSSSRGNSRADLASSGPVTGTASGTSVVDNLLGTGPCFVTTTGSAKTICR